MNTTKAVSILGATLLGALVIGATSAPAGAATPRTLTVVGHPRDIATRYVTFADLDLASGGGRQVLHRRVEAAVHDVCTEVVGHYDFDGRADCGSDAWLNATPQMARAVRRAREIAATGSSSLTAAAVVIRL